MTKLFVTVRISTIAAVLAAAALGRAGWCAAAEPPPGPLRLTLDRAVSMSLENNRSFRAEKLNPEIARTAEAERLADFDPLLEAELVMEKARVAVTGDGFRDAGSVGLAASLGKTYATGTDISLGAAVDSTEGGRDSGSVSLSVTQAILRGRSREANLALLNEARFDSLISEYELRGFAEALVAEVETTYWDYVQAGRRMAISSRSLELAEQQLAETQERVNVGTLAEVELAAARAEVALRREDLINARSTLETTRLNLLRLLNPGPAGWGTEILAEDEPSAPADALDDVEDHVRLALRRRPDLNQARLRVERGDLELVRTRDGLLPRLDFFLTLGKSGYGDSVAEALGDLGGEAYEARGGVQFEYPPLNRRAKAAELRAVLGRRQSLEALRNMASLVQVDVRSAWLEVARQREQAAATAATRALQEEKLRAETEKFRVGRSTTFLVAQAQRDLLSAQIDELAASAGYLKAFTELWRLEGSLLARRGIQAPGEKERLLPEEALD